MSVDSVDGGGFGPLHPETRFESLANEKERRVFGPSPGKTHFADAAPVGLTFNELRAANLARVVKFPGHKAWQNIPETMLAGWGYNDWMVALTGEVGELANLLKKRRRGWVGEGQQDWSPDDAARELADIQTYLDLLAACLGVDLGEATRAKFNIVSERAGLPDRL